MRECLPRAIRNRPEPRYNKGGAIAVVKSTESLNSWYRLLGSLPSSFWPIPRAVIPRMRARNYPESGERSPSLFLLTPEDSAITWRALARACLFRPAIWSASISFSLSEERIYHAKSRWVERNSMVLEVRISTDSAFSFCTFQRSHYIFAVFEDLCIPQRHVHLRIWKIFGQLRFLKYVNVGYSCVHGYSIGNLATQFECLISIFINYSSISKLIYFSDITAVASLFRDRICDVQIIILHIYVLFVTSERIGKDLRFTGFREVLFTVRKGVRWCTEIVMKEALTSAVKASFAGT